MSELFYNIMEVVGYLNQSGFNIKKSAVYLHRKQGKLLSDEKGYFPKKNVEQYAKNWLSGNNGASAVTSVIDLQEQKLKAETEKMLAQAEHWQIKTQIQRGLYVEKEIFEKELAARAYIFRSDMENFIRSRAGEMVAMVSGDAEKAPDLIEYFIENLENWLSRYSEEKTEWEAVLDGEITGDN